MKVYIVKAGQLSHLRKLKMTDGSEYNPIEDANGNLVITQDEIDKSDKQWVLDLEQINYEPKLIQIDI